METIYYVDTRKLKTAMVAAGYDTYDSLANVAGISSRTISSIVNGKNPTYRVMCKLSKALGLSSEQAGKIFFAPNLRIA